MRALGRLAVVSWLGGAVSVVPFAEEWFELESATVNWALFAALASSVAVGFAIALSARLQRLVSFLAGPPRPRARALVLVATFAATGALAMIGALALASG